jgi:hypothetical protein
VGDAGVAEDPAATRGSGLANLLAAVAERSRPETADDVTLLVARLE